MARSQRLRVGEVRAVYRLAGECRELGDDSVIWQRHLFVELNRLISGRVGVGGHLRGVLEPALLMPIEILDVGWRDEADRSHYVRFVNDLQQRSDPVFRKTSYQVTPSGLWTRSRDQLVSDREWYTSEIFNEYMRKAKIDAGILSWHRWHPEVVHGITVHRPVGDRMFGRRERQLVRLLHGEIGPLIGNALAGPGRPGRSGLSPRLREAMDCLLDGDGEKQAARRMGLRLSTVHEYVKAIYVHFGVSSRAELLAWFLRRLRGRGGDA
jgi:DNA-binding CsgD family transcriptional regulator